MPFKNTTDVWNDMCIGYWMCWIWTIQGTRYEISCCLWIHDSIYVFALECKIWCNRISTHYGVSNKWLCINENERVLVRRGEAIMAAALFYLLPDASAVKMFRTLMLANRCVSKFDCADSGAAPETYRHFLCVPYIPKEYFSCFQVCIYKVKCWCVSSFLQTFWKNRACWVA